jgi:peptide/nickel transport system permease protein
MSSFLIRRLIQSFAVLGVMSFVIYALMGLMPGDPVDLMISGDPRLTPEDAERLKGLFGLDKPVTERYLNWATAALQGDLGYSRLFARPVGEVLWPALGNTARLVGLAFTISLVIGLSAGIWAAVRPYSRRDYLINFLAFAGISVPSFWLGLMLIIAFAVMLGVLPAGGMETVGLDSAVDRARHLVLPVATLVIASVGGHTRYMRASMIETLRADFIRTAYAKGASRRRVVLGHALRNALIPVVTIVALEFGFLFSGALITETIFSYPGMGKLIFDAIMGNDFNLALTALMLATLLTLVGNLAADVTYAALDPRITLE